MQSDPQLRYLFELIPDGRIFRRWCDRAGVGSLEQFIEVDLSEAPEPWHGPWVQVQGALRVADGISRTESPAKGCATLDRLLRRPPARVRADVLTLRKLTPIIGVKVQVPAVRMSAREALDRLGGVAGARAVARMLSEHLDRTVTVRQVRDRFRNTGGRVRKLGAGYFATQGFRGATVLHWVESRLTERGGETLDGLCRAVLEAFPHGDERAVRAWIHQQPGVLSVRGERVRLVEQCILQLDDS